jgi:hypothetical protein
VVVRFSGAPFTPVVISLVEISEKVIGARFLRATFQVSLEKAFYREHPILFLFDLAKLGKSRIDASESCGTNTLSLLCVVLPSPPEFS